MYELVKTVSPATEAYLLNCGHYTEEMSNRTVLLDFPNETVHCPTCKDKHHFAPRLRNLLGEVRRTATS